MKKNIWVGGSVVLLGGILAVAFWPAPAPPEDLAERPLEEAAEYLASQNFKRLDEDRKVEVLSEVLEAGRTHGLDPRAVFRDVDEDQREQLRENVRPVMRQVMAARMKEYFELPEKERVAYLDQMIDQGRGMLGRGGPGGGPPPGRDGEADRRGAGGDGERPGPSPERMKQRLESSDPAQRARMQEFFKDMRERMEQRGIEPPQGPPGPP